MANMAKQANQDHSRERKNYHSYKKIFKMNAKTNKKISQRLSEEIKSFKKSSLWPQKKFTVHPE